MRGIALLIHLPEKQITPSRIVVAERGNLYIETDYCCWAGVSF